MALENSKNGLIDPLENLIGAPVINLVSDRDPVITNAMMEANEKVFKALRTNAKFMNKKAGHIWPRDDLTNNRPKCELQEKMNDNCNYDFSGDMLTHFYFNNTKSGVTKDTWKPRDTNAK
jgi:hypothetical protein